MTEMLNILMQLLLLNRKYMHKPTICGNKSDRDLAEMVPEIQDRVKCVIS